MIKTFCTLLLAFSCSFLMAQNAGLYPVTGQVQDATTNAPIPYASLRTGDHGTGTITNNEGSFTINVPAGQHAIWVSCIGYASVKVNTINNGRPIIVKLSKSTGMLKDVVITTETPAQIVAHAYRNIPKNYPLTNTLYTGFYRESTLRQPDDSAEVYNYIIEAVIKHNKPSYLKSKPEGDIKIENARTSIFRANIGQFWKAGAFTPIRFDVAKKRPDFIDPTQQKNYTYAREDNTTYYDEPVFVVSFKPRKKAYYTGLLYINTHSYAIVKVDYELTDHGLHDDPDVYGGARGLSDRKYKVNYQPISNKWYLQSIWQQANSKDDSTKYRYMTEFATTRIDADSTLALDYADRLQFNEVLSLKPSPYNAGFWKNYNIVAETQQLKDLLIDTTRAVTPMVPISTPRASSQKNADDMLAGFRNKPDSTLTNQQRSLKKAISILDRFRPLFIIPGVTLLQNSATSISLNYTNAQGNTIINQAVPVKANATTVGFGFGFEYDLMKNLEVHYIAYSAYGNYNNSALDFGLGYRLQISPARKRPVFLMVAANYSVNNISQKLNQYQYSGAPVAVGDKNFSYDIRPTLFSRQAAFKPQLGLGIELNKRLSIYAQTGYNVYISQTDAINFKSHSGNFFKDFFPGKQELPINATGVNLLVDNKPNQQLPYRANWFFSLGMKGYLSFK